MRIPILKLALLVSLLVVSAASRLVAGQKAPESAQKKKVIVASPEKEIVVDGDRVVVWNDGGDADFDDAEVIADLPDFDDELRRAFRLHEHRMTGYLGVRPIEMTPELRKHFGGSEDAGVLVGTVEPDSPAARAGILVGDILTTIGGERIGSPRALSRSVRRRKGGETLKVELLRDRASKTVSVTVAEHEEKAIRIGDLGHWMRGLPWSNPDAETIAPVPPLPPTPPAPPDGPRWIGLQERMNSLEKRLKDIESRLPPH